MIEEPAQWKTQRVLSMSFASYSKPNRWATHSQSLEKRNPPPKRNRKGKVSKAGDPMTVGGKRVKGDYSKSGTGTKSKSRSPVSE